MKLTQERVRALFVYSEGNLVRKTYVCPNAQKGMTVGCIDNFGYLRVRIDGKYYRNHRVIFLYFHGYLPENDIDHIDRNRLNNKIENLREVSRSCNHRNRAQYPSVSGVKGIVWDNSREKWLAQIKINKKHINLGRTDCFLEAVCLRFAAEQASGWADCESESPAHEYVRLNIRHATPEEFKARYGSDDDLHELTCRLFGETPE